jgi:hypothetical protein
MRVGLALAAASLTLLASAVAPAAVRSIAGQDQRATSNARNLVSEVEACWTEFEDYSECRSAKVLNAGMGEFAVPIGKHRGQARVSRATRTTYTVDSWSRSGTHFYVRKTSRGTLVRTCSRHGRGLCRPSGHW